MRAVATSAAMIALSAVGCASTAAPPEPKAPVIVIEGSYDYFFQAPTYAEGSAKLDPIWRRYLVEDLAVAMKGHPKEFVLVEIEGHASAGEADPVALSTARAKEAIDLLIAAGVAPQRLTARGYGAYCPWEEDAEKNRRIVFRVLRTSYGESGVERGCAAAKSAGLGP